MLLLLLQITVLSHFNITSNPLHVVNLISLPGPDPDYIVVATYTWIL